jgi:hypothetical protein
MDKENAVYIHNGVLFIHKEQNYIIFRKMDGTGVTILSKISHTQKGKYYVFSYMWNLETMT